MVQEEFGDENRSNLFLKNSTIPLSSRALHPSFIKKVTNGWHVRQGSAGKRVKPKRLTLKQDNDFKISAL